MFWTKPPRPFPPFGGLASFISFLGTIGWAGQGQQPLPLAEPTSNKAIPLAHALTAFLMSVVVGAPRFAHREWLRAERVWHAMPGLERLPGDDPIRNFFRRFSQAHIEAFWRPLWRWLLLLLKCPNGSFALDLDSTGFCREGKQEGARKGFPSSAQRSQQPSSALGGAGGGAVHLARWLAQWKHGRGARGRSVFAAPKAFGVAGGDVAAHGASRQRIL